MSLRGRAPLSLSPPSLLNCGVIQICDRAVTPNTCNCRTWTELPQLFECWLPHLLKINKHVNAQGSSLWSSQRSGQPLISSQESPAVFLSLEPLTFPQNLTDPLDLVWLPMNYIWPKILDLVLGDPASLHPHKDAVLYVFNLVKL